MVRCLFFLLCSYLAALLPGSLSAQEPEPPAGELGVLFTSDELLNLTIEAPLRSIFREREQESEYHDATLTLGGPDGNEVVLNVGLKTRGKFRLQRSTCEFPPLRLNIRTRQAENTVFAGQDKLKLVTHCQDGRSQNEQHVLQEYLAYRIYNLVSDLSFHVRLARITYVDTDGDRDTLTRYAFLIEDEELLAQRAGWQALEPPMVQPEIYVQDQLNLVEVFQYLIGNTDWDAFRNAPDEDVCCHNVKVIGDPAGPVFPIPYDFDFSGIVDTRYATPDPSLNIGDVRQRVYRGICRPREEIDETLRVFQEQKEAIYALYRNQAGLEERTLERSIEYLDDFFEIIEDPGKVQQQNRTGLQEGVRGNVECPTSNVQCPTGIANNEAYRRTAVPPYRLLSRRTSDSPASHLSSCATNRDRLLLLDPRSLHAVQDHPADRHVARRQFDCVRSERAGHGG